MGGLTTWGVGGGGGEALMWDITVCLLRVTKFVTASPKTQCFIANSPVGLCCKCWANPVNKTKIFV